MTAETIAFENTSAEENLATRIALLQTVPLLSGLPEPELRAVAAGLNLTPFTPGETIVQEGEPGASWYLLQSGQAAVVSRDLIGQAVTLATLTTGQHFGEVALVTGDPRSATVQAVDEVEALVLDRGDFLRLEQSCPEFGQRVRRHVYLLDIDTFLRKASPFANLPGEALRRLAGQLYPQRVTAGEVIIREGEEGDRFYLIRRGRVEVLRGERRAQVMDAGDFFGEVALLAPVKRTATVRALEDTELLALDKAEFQAVVQEYQSLQGRFAEFVRVRVGEAIAKSVQATDPLATLMPELDWSRRSRYWKILLAGLALFAGLSFVAFRFPTSPVVYAAVFVGAFLGPVVYVMYLAESHLLPENPVNLAITFVLAAALGIPFAIHLEEALGTRAGTLSSAAAIGLVEEMAKMLGVFWLIWRSRSRFQMDGIVYGAAAGMGFAAFESVLYGIHRAEIVTSLLSTLWLRLLLSPFGHGTWTAIICGALWRQGQGGKRGALEATGAFALAVGLHTLWDWQPVSGILLIGWMVVIGLIGLEVLRRLMERATRSALGAVLSLNPEAAQAQANDPRVSCRVCGQLSPPGTHYCVRCGAALRR